MINCLKNNEDSKNSAVDDIIRIAEEGRDTANKYWQKWAENPTPNERWDFVTEAFPRVFVYNGGGVVPFQVEGVVGDLGFYLRERREHATLTLFDKSQDYINSPRHLYRASYPYDISGTKDNFLHLFELMYENMEKIVPMWIIPTNDGDKDSTTYARAWTPEEAIQKAEDYIVETKFKTKADWTAYFMQYYRTDIPDEKVIERATETHKYLSTQEVRIVGKPELDSRSVMDAPEFDEVRIDLYA